VISGNGVDGVRLRGTAGAKLEGNTIVGNYIGVDKTGMVAYGNSQNGIYLEGCMNTTIGGTVDAARNVISGNGTDATVGGYGVHLGLHTVNCVVQKNYIGRNADNTANIVNSLGWMKDDGTGNQWLDNEHN
jgi:hypothetical protein